jgi:hypothetical protein
MPLTTYTAGEVLTAASLNANFSFAAANPPGGLTLISATTIGSAVSTVGLTNIFSTTYDAYKIFIAGGVGSGTNQEFNVNLTGSTASYYNTVIYASYGAGSASVIGANNGAAWTYLGWVNTTTLSLNLDLVNPFLAKPTTMQSQITRSDIGGIVNGIHNVSTSYTGLTLAPSSGTITGGTVYVYGYAKA